MDAHIQHDLTRTVTQSRQRLPASRCGDEDIGLQTVSGQIGRAAVAYRNRRMPMQHKHRSRSADDQASTRDDGMLSFDRNAVVFEYPDAGLGRTGRISRAVSGVHAGKRTVCNPVDILFRRQRFPHGAVIDVRRQRSQYQNAVNRRIATSLPHGADEFVPAHVRFEAKRAHRDPHRLAAPRCAPLVRQIARIVADPHDEQARIDPRGAQCVDALCRFVRKRIGDRFTIQDVSHLLCSFLLCFFYFFNPLCRGRRRAVSACFPRRPDGCVRSRETHTRPVRRIRTERRIPL